jgi:hypothetical protein
LPGERILTLLDIPLPLAAAFAALRGDVERLKIIKQQIKAIEQARRQQFEQKPEARANRMVYLLVRMCGLGWRQPIFSRMSFCPEHYAIIKQKRVMPD